MTYLVEQVEQLLRTNLDALIGRTMKFPYGTKCFYGSKGLENDYAFAHGMTSIEKYVSNGDPERHLLKHKVFCFISHRAVYS